jgi:hypothetical protein
MKVEQLFYMMDLTQTIPPSVSATRLGVEQLARTTDKAKAIAHGRAGEYKYDFPFDTTHRPGGTAPLSGIYRCTICGWEEVFVANTTLPPQNHHTHAPGLTHILWRLSAYARHAANGSRLIAS